MYIIDSLCGIYNRNGFRRCAEQMLSECKKKHLPMMISFIDMDGLKTINDTYGHDDGDYALKLLARAIQESCSGDQVCARVGGDEFIIVGTGCTQADADRMEQTLAERLSVLNDAEQKLYHVSASVGTFITDIREDMKLFTLIMQADQKMYQMKKARHSAEGLPE